MSRYSRQIRIDAARRRIEDSPLPLTWFDFFKRGSLPFQVIAAVASAAALVIIAVYINNPAVNAIPFDTLRNTVTGYCVTFAVLSVFSAALAILLFRKLSELTVGAYRLTLINLIYTVTYGLSKITIGRFFLLVVSEQSTAEYEASLFTFMMLLLTSWAIVNFIYFRNRRYLFQSCALRPDCFKTAEKIYTCRFCPYCGAKLAENSTLCDKCGKNL